MSGVMHTPGPWMVLPEEMDKPYLRVRGTVLGMRYKVANVLTPAYDGVSAREAEETRANARLIAAAPELLEALKALTGSTSHETYGDALASARIAITKVTGSHP